MRSLVAYGFLAPPAVQLIFFRCFGYLQDGCCGKGTAAAMRLSGSEMEFPDSTCPCIF
jgi:hypothetical protein